MAIAPFYKAHPIALPKPTLDLEAPLRFHLFDYDRIVPVGRFYYKGTRLVFDPKRQGKRSPTAAAAQRKAEKLALSDARRAKKSGGKPGESLVSKSRTITVQTYGWCLPGSVLKLGPHPTPATAEIECWQVHRQTR